MYWKTVTVAVNVVNIFSQFNEAGAAATVDGAIQFAHDGTDRQTDIQTSDRSITLTATDHKMRVRSRLLHPFRYRCSQRNDIH